MGAEQLFELRRRTFDAAMWARAGGLAVVAAACAGLATSAFRAYQRGA